MDHLLEQFKEALSQEANSYVSNGRVYIRTHHWTPDEVLEGMLNTDAFQEAFRDWIQEREDEQITAADQILADFSEEDRFRTLSEIYERGSITPFIGAGLSIPSDYPGWTAFLKSLRGATSISEDELLQLLDDGKYEEAAEQLSNALGPAFNEEIENAYGCKRKLYGAIQYIPYCFETPIVTTNFDDVAKRCHDEARKPFEDILSATQTDEIPKALAAGRRILIKLHGTSRSGHGRVLTKSEYENHYGNGARLKEVLLAMCNRTLLFMGCSLSVDRTLSVLRALVQENGHDNVARHYAFLEDPGSHELRVARRSELVECNIYPIWFPQGEHDSSIEAFMTKLKATSE